MGDIDYTGLFLSKLESVRFSGGSWMARCPAHDDGTASLHVSRGEHQPVVLKCHAGCEPDAILAATGLRWADLCEPAEATPRRGEWTPYGEAVAIYDYTSADGTLLYQVCRTARKDFPQRIPDPASKSGWRWKGSVERVLYRLPRVIEAVANGETIYVVEGEKDVHAIEGAGGVGTCNPGGAGKWLASYSGYLAGARVRILADKDKPGQAHARAVRLSLLEAEAIVEIAEAAEGCKDAADHLSAGLSLSDFEVTCPSGAEPALDLAPDLYDFLAIVDPPNNWVIPDILERGDRLILTGFEGLGKSVLTRMLAMAAAGGVQPFTNEPSDPMKVLFIDCENPDRKARRHFAKLEFIARAQGFPVPKGALRIIQRPAGIDLTTEEDAQWLVERVTAHRPDLIVVGPFYRLHAADMNDERAARLVVSALDRARLAADCALITEAHAGHGEAGVARSVRPIGSSLLLRWPEFGFGLRPQGEADAHGHCHHATVVPWRGPREERDWPRQLSWATHPTEWPWTPTKPGLTAVGS